MTCYSLLLLSKILLIFTIVSAGSSAVAQRVVGNGGVGVLCESQSRKNLELLDFYDGRILWDHSTVLVDEARSTEDMRKYILRRAFLVDPSRAVAMSVASRDFFQRVKFLSNVDLTNTEDSLNVALPAGCSKKQIAIQTEPRFPGEKKFIIDQAAWDLFNEKNKLGLIFHELFYEESLQYNVKDSYGVRYLTSLWFSDQILATSKTQYSEVLEAALFQSKGFSSFGSSSDKVEIKILPLELWQNRFTKKTTSNSNGIEISEKPAAIGEQKIIRFSGTDNESQNPSAYMPIIGAENLPRNLDRLSIDLDSVGDAQVSIIISGQHFTYDAEGEERTYEAVVKLRAGVNSIVLKLEDFKEAKSLKSAGAVLKSWMGMKSIGISMLPQSKIASTFDITVRSLALTQ